MEQNKLFLRALRHTATRMHLEAAEWAANRLIVQCIS